MKRNLLPVETQGASQEGTLVIEQFLMDNYRFRRNILNGKVEFVILPKAELSADGPSNAPDVESDLDYRPLTQAAHAVNLSLTARNWLVGYYIVEYEQHGEDRAKYGDNLINRLADRLNQRGFNPRRLRDYRHVYQVYPILGGEIYRYLQNNRILAVKNSQIGKLANTFREVVL